MRRLFTSVTLMLASLAGVGTAAFAQDVPSVPSPLRVEGDSNGVNLTSGKTTIDPPVLFVPAAPNLRFDRVQNAAPYVIGKKSGQAGEYPTGNYTIHTGQGSAEAFQCFDVSDCASVTGTGSYFRPNATFRQAGTAAVWHFTNVHVNTFGNPGTFQAYASSVTYPTGETISYSYDTAYLAGDSFNRTFYRPNRVTSNHGYEISITYQGTDFNGDPGAWSAPSVVTLYATANPGVPLGRLTYSGNTITDLGGRVYTCSGCNNGLGMDVETTQGSFTLPAEGAPARQVTVSPSAQLVSTVVRDGVPFNYTYTYNGGAPYFYAPTNSYWYTRLVVTGPNGFSQTYNFTISQQRVVLTGMVDSINRTTGYQYDTAYRPTRITSPEGNYVSVLFDDHSNVISRTTTPKPGSGLAAVVETATFPYCDPIVAPDVSCFRATSSRDGLNRQTDFIYNNAGQLTEQTDPADADGVRRKTYIEYTASPAGIIRKSVVRICGLGSTCGTNQEIRTEYDYWGSTPLLSAERHIDAATGVTLTTTYSYDSAGRPTAVDGPLPGTDDAAYFRYDVLGRKTWEIGPKGANGLRSAKRFTYRDSDDNVIAVEVGTVPDQGSQALTALQRTDASYDGHRNPVREATSAGGTTFGLTERSFNDRGQLTCQAQRMNAATFGIVTDGCALAATGSFGPDRITHNVYDAAGQLLQVQRAYGTSLQQNYTTYEYTPNGKQKAVIDANGSRAEITFDGFDRQRRWLFPSPTVAGVTNQSDYQEYGYDIVGNRTSLRKRDGVTLTYQYDGLNRMTVKNAPASATGAPGYSVSYGYDLRGLVISARFGSQNGAGITNAWDSLGRQISTSTNLDGTARTISYQYNAASKRTRVSATTGYVMNFAYDDAGNVTSLYDANNETVVQFGYDPAGRGQTLALGPGGNSPVTYGYDAIGRLSSIGHTIAATPAYQALTFGYNPASQVVTRTSSNDTFASNTAYNVSRTYGVNGLNQYTAAGSATFQYDANGNLTSDGSTAYVYDAENRLVSRSDGVSLSYDPLGRLWQLSAPSGTTRFEYDGDRLLEEFNTSGNWLRIYAWGPGRDEPLIWYEGTGGPVRRFLHADHQGSIIAATDDSGNPIALNGYDAWGIPNAANAGRFQYTGQAWLAELGMYYYKARLYSPTLGRFLQTDPVGYAGGINLYSYVGNDPMSFTDPSGMGRVCVTDAPTGTRIAETRCVDVDGNRNGNSRENDLTQRQINKIKSSFGRYISRFGVSPKGRVPDLAPYQKPIGGDGADWQKDDVSIVTQFYGYVAARFTDVAGSSWSRISRVNVNAGPSPYAAAPAELSDDGTLLTFTGQSLGAHPGTPFYYESFSDVARITIHEGVHGWRIPMSHQRVDDLARRMLKTLGMDGDGCAATNGFLGC